MPSPSITAFGDGAHDAGETGLTVSGAGFGPFEGELWIYENSDQSGNADQLTVSGDWNDMEITGVEIPSSLNNSAGTAYLFLQRSDLAWSFPFEFTLNTADPNTSNIPSVSMSVAVGTPQFQTTENSNPNIGELPFASLILTANAPQITTTEGLDSNEVVLPSASLSVNSSVPQFVTTEDANSNECTLPSVNLSVTTFSPEIVTTEGADSQFSQLPAASLSVVTNSPQFITTTGTSPNTCILPETPLSLATNSPEFTVSENNLVQLSTTGLSMGTFSPEFTCTEDNIIEIDSASLLFSTFSPVFIVPDGYLTMTVTATSTEINEDSPIQVTVTFRDADNQLLTVSTVEWRLIDVSSQSVIVDWTSLVSENPLTFVVTAAHNDIIDTRRSSEQKQVIIRANNGLITESHEYLIYTVKNLLIE